MQKEIQKKYIKQNKSTKPSRKKYKNETKH